MNPTFLVVGALTFATLLSVLPGNDYARAQQLKSATPANPSQAVFTVGEVMKIDGEQRKVTIKHGPLENLGMPPMTMVFRLANPEMLGKLRVGEIINFRADKIDGAFTVVELRPGT